MRLEHFTVVVWWESDLQAHADWGPILLASDLGCLALSSQPSNVLIHKMGQWWFFPGTEALSSLESKQ